jgi:hypothetical protein
MRRDFFLFYLLSLVELRADNVLEIDFLWSAQEHTTWMKNKNTSTQELENRRSSCISFTGCL